MAKQTEQNESRNNDIFPTTLRALLEHHPKDGHSTTYKALGEGVGVRQQTISQYASGQTQPTADVALRIARFFGVSVDYLLTGVSSYNKDYAEELGLSDTSVELLRRAKDMYPQTDLDHVHTMPYLDELLSDKDFYEFLDGLYYSVESLKSAQAARERMQKAYEGLNIEGYFTWQMQMDIQEFIQKEIQKLGLDAEPEQTILEEE